MLYLAKTLLICALFAPSSAVALSSAAGQQRFASAPVRSMLSMQAVIDAKTVKTLRDATGAGMMDCKKALQEHDGDMEKATEMLEVTAAVEGCSAEAAEASAVVRVAVEAVLTAEMTVVR